MSILASPTVLVPCDHQCGHSVRLPADSNSVPTCERCRKSDAWSNAQSTIADVKAIVAGTGVFGLLSVEERAEQLQGILGAIESAAPLLFPDLKKLDDQTIIGIVSDQHTPDALLYEATAELARRLSAPTSDERDEIEQRIEADGDYQDAERWDCCT